MRLFIFIFRGMVWAWPRLQHNKGTVIRQFVTIHYYIYIASSDDNFSVNVYQEF